MDKSTIIKLRQSEAEETVNNGSYSVVLKQGVTIEEGDVVKVHTIVLDTATESVVSVENDLQIQMGVAKYFNNWKNDYPVPYTSKPTIQSSQPDLKRNWMSTRNDTGADSYYVQSIVIMNASTNFFSDFGDNYVSRWRYFQSGTGKESFHNINFGKHKIINHINKGIEIPINTNGTGLIIKGKIFELVGISPAQLEKHPIRVLPFGPPQGIPTGSVPNLLNPINSSVVYGNNGDSLSAVPDTINLYEEDLIFTLKADTYTPAEIAQVFNDKMTRLDALGTVGYDVTQNQYPVMNPFLATIHQMGHAINVGTQTFVVSPGSTVEIPNPPNILEFDNQAPTQANDILIGASQVSMNFDLNLKKINFDALHVPIFPEPPTGPVAPGVDYPTAGTFLVPRPVPNNAADPTVPIVPQINDCGAAFTRLDAFEILTTNPDGSVLTLGDRVDFFKTLGFDETILVQNTHSSIALDLGDGSSIYPLTVSSTAGINIIGAESTLDGLIPKAPLAGASFLTPFIGFVATDLTTPILSNRTFDEVANDEGYFLLEIGMKMPQNMIGGSKLQTQTDSNKVQSIIGKYYTQGNFLQSQGQGEIIYTHVGEPQYINQLDVRVLHPDFSVPSNTELGKRNTVFLEVIKPAIRLVNKDS